jgi:FG-GAP repeat
MRTSAIAVAASLVVVTAASAQSVQRAGALDLLTGASVRIDGGAADDRAGVAVATGDVDGDGRDDVVVGAEGADQNARLNSGSVYVVFGAAVRTLDLGAAGAQGFRIDGAAAGDRAGSTVAVADVNGDGRDDVVVGAELADGGGRNEAGSVYVVYGKATTEPVDLASLGVAGLRVDGATLGDRAGGALGAAGDVNGDRREDLVIGAPRFDAGGSDSGAAYVVFGTTSAATIDLAELGAGGFRIAGAAAGDRAGVAVAGAGDVNRDGRADVLVGADGAEHSGRRFSGSAYVVFGRAGTDTVDLAQLAQGGFRIDGPASALVGTAVAAAGDVNADGPPDVLVGGPGADLFSGVAYVVFGQTSSATIDLTALGTGGFRIDGAAAGDRAGGSVAAAGDVDGDDRDDVLVAADGADHRQRRDAGAVYVVFGGRATEAVDLAALGAGGFAIDGASAGDSAGASLAASGGIGRLALVVGAPRSDNNGRLDSGSVHVASIDGRPPRLSLGGSPAQRVVARRRVVVAARCDEPCELSARGLIAIRGTRRGVPLAPATARLAQPGLRGLTLGIGRPELRRLASALRRGARARATVTVRALDPAGNASASTRTIVVRA